MVFSSIIFLFLFLPVVLLLYRLIPRTQIVGQNIFLLLVSSLFYFYGEQEKILLLYAVVCLNYLCARYVYSGVKDEFYEPQMELLGTVRPYEAKRRGQTMAMMACVVVCIGLLWYFKYFNFTLDILTYVSQGTLNFEHIGKVILPLGISFYTFHVLSYSLDIYFGRMALERNLLNFASYVLMFPQLVAGPIVRYRDIMHQFRRRTVTSIGFANGVRRFCYGLAKKVLLANTVSVYADKIFATDPAALSVGDAWLGVLAYALQIYFDFSGYSDMAIGLALMFGFHYKENFNYPYIAKSAGEFWHRWHISLSTWLRDYVYIHLGGNRSGLYKTCRNIMLVFLCSGLWHGANITFVCWGGIYGLCGVLEKLGLRNFLHAHYIFAHVYLLLVALAGWVMFRADSVSYACDYLAVMYGLGPSGWQALALTQPVATNIWAAIALGVFFSCDWRPVYKRIVRSLARACGRAQVAFLSAKLLSYGVAVLLFVVSAASIISSSYNPFIYFRF